MVCCVPQLASRLKRGGKRPQTTSTIPVPGTASGPSASKDATPLSTEVQPTSSTHNTGLLDLAPIALSAPPSTKDGVRTAAIPPPSEKVASTVVCSPTPLSLWEEAYNQAHDQAEGEIKAWLEKNASGPKTDDHVAELVDLVRCSEEKHQKEAAKLKIGDREILWRDYAEKVVASVTAIGDIGITFAPAPSSAAWSAVKVLLNTNVSERKDLVVIMGCSEVVLRLYRRGKVYEKVFIANSPGSDIYEELERKLIEVYKSCFEFLAFVATEIQKGNGTRFLDALLDPGRGEERVSEMKDFEQQLDSTAHACEIEMNDEHRKLLQSLEGPLKRVDNNVVDVLQKLEKSEREEAMNYISTIPVGIHHEAKRAKRTKDTCEWLTSHAGFLEWEDSACSSILWLQGFMGTGKSFLSSKVIDRYRSLSNTKSTKGDDEGFAYFYCDNSDQARNTVDNILRSYVRQLSELPGRCESIHKAAWNLYKTKTQIQNAISTDASIATLKEMLHSYPRSTLVLDGLDECDEDTRGRFFAFIKPLILESNRPLKVFIASRPEYDINGHLNSFQGSRTLININTSDNKGDIEKFIDSEMGKLSVNWEEVGTATKMRVKQTLIDKSDGMFRWTYLQWEQLKIIKSEKYIKERLDKLPKTLSEAYQEILDGYDPELPNLRMLQRAVRWVMCARRPLDSDVLLSALKAESESRDGDDCFEQSDLTEGKLEDACRHLVVRDPELGVWKFPHASVLDYLKGEKFEWISNAPAQLTVFMINCLKSCCSNYPSKWPPQHVMNGDNWAMIHWLDSDSTDTEDILDPRHPLQRYILENWVEHTRDLFSQDAKATRVDQALQQFFGEPGPQRSSKEYRVFIQMANWHGRLHRTWQLEIDPVDNNVFGTIALGLHRALAGWWDKNLDIPSLVNDGNSDLLSIAATCGQSEICKDLIDAGCDIQSAVCASIRGNEVDTLKLLLRRVANPNLGIDGHSYLCYASSYCSLKCLQLLLKHGADPNFRCNNDSQGKGRCRYGNALVNAASYGFFEMVKALVEQKAAVNPVNIGGYYGSPLAGAVSGGHLECARFLVEHGADIPVNQEPGMCGGPMVAALRNNQVECARFLVQQGADVNAVIQFRDFGSPLAFAIEADRPRSTRFLIENGADVNADLQFGDFGCPLGVAAAEGDLEVGRLLLKHGAEPNTSLRFGTFGSPLAVAVAEGSLEYARLFVDSGADVHATLEFGVYGSALAAAVLGRHDGSLDMIKFLVEENEADLAQLVNVPPGKQYTHWCGCKLRIKSGVERCAVAVYLLRERGLDFQILASLGFSREESGLSSSSSGSSIY